MKDFRMIEWGGLGWVDMEEQVITARRGDTVKGYFTIKNTGDTVIDDLLIHAAPDPFAKFSDKQVQMNDLMMNCLYFTSSLPDKIMPGEEVTVYYTLDCMYSGPFQFIILASASNPTGEFHTGPPFNYNAVVTGPYINREEWFIDFNLPAPPRRSRGDYEDIAIAPTGGDLPYIPWIWLKRGDGGEWKIRAYLNAPGGFTPRIQDYWMGYIYTGFSVPHDPGRLVNYEWLKSQSPTATVNITSWRESTCIYDYFVVKGVIR